MKTEKQNVLRLEATEHTTAMVSYWDKDLICRFANSELAAWFGTTKEEIINKISIKELLGPLYEERIHYINGALEGVNQTFQREVSSPSGINRHVLSNYYPHIVDGKVMGFYVNVTDITHLKLLEKELIATNERIDEQNKRLLNFSNIVSHNLKNYANSFSGMMILLDEPNSPEDQTEIIGHIKRISNNFSDTIKNLTEIVYVQNMSNIESIPLNLYDQIVKAISTISMKIKNSNGTIKNNVDPKIGILCNPAYIESILVNFLTNAIKYRHPDRDPIIELNCITYNDEIILTIADNGKGINLETHGKDLFGMYKTFHGNDDAQGLGLYTTKYQVEVMGGSIEVESEEDKGSKFIIHFKQK
jgi:PAS domain S-box-containing protein